MKLNVLRLIVVALTCACAVIVIGSIRTQHASANQDKFARLYSALGMPAPEKNLLMIIVGGDALALNTARELCQLRDRRIVVLWPADAEFAHAVEGVGAEVNLGEGFIGTAAA